MSLLSLSKKILSKEKPAKKTGKAVAAKKAVKTDKGPSAQPVDSLAAGRIKLQVIMTEKSIGQQEGNTIVLRVAPDATKGQISAAVQEKFGVKALSIRTSNQSPKNRRRGASQGRTNFWKKAYVSVNDIQSITTGP